MTIIVIFLLLLAGALLLFAIALFSFLIYSIIIGELKDAPYVPSRREKVAVMVRLAEIRPGETIMDLGSGNGIILLSAARHGAKAIGIEINPFLAVWSRWLARRAGFREQVKVIRGDFHRYPLRDAEAVFLYLWPGANAALKDKLARELKPGSRIVTNTFPIPGWIPEKEENKVYLYRI